jgi:hypothetical protein
MKSSLQIFVYQTSGISESANNYPYLLFDSKTEAHEFVSQLISRPYHIHCEEESHFVLNNPQHLPDSIRDKHRYLWVVEDEDGVHEIQKDGCYYIEDNIDLLRKCEIIDNTLEEDGFSRIVNNWPNKTSV